MHLSNVKIHLLFLFFILDSDYLFPHYFIAILSKKGDALIIIIASFSSIIDLNVTVHYHTVNNNYDCILHTSTA